MKLYYDKRLSDPTYYAQQGYRNGKKTTTRNVKNFGKHSELLKITDDPIAYVKAEIEKMNAEYRSGRYQIELTCDFRLKYEYVIKCISYVTGKREANGEIIRIAEKIKFAAPVGN